MRPQVLSVVRRRNAFLFLEDAAEIQGIIIADDAGDLIDVVVCSFQQTDGVVDSYGESVSCLKFRRNQLIDMPLDLAYSSMLISSL